MRNKNASAGGAVYGLGFIGAIVYYMQHAANLTEILLGFVKAIVWPALLTYNLFGFLKM